jgi:flagellar biosynthesis protein FlhA
MNPTSRVCRPLAGRTTTFAKGAAAPDAGGRHAVHDGAALPPGLLDVFFTINIAVALMVMMVAAYMLRPLDFAAFPAVLLLTT